MIAASLAVRQTSFASDVEHLTFPAVSQLLS